MLRLLDAGAVEYVRGFAGRPVCRFCRSLVVAVVVVCLLLPPLLLLLLLVMLLLRIYAAGGWRLPYIALVY